MIMLEQFWEWLNPDNDYYEIRIKNYNLIKFIAEKLNISYSASGVYINNLEDYKKILPYIKDETVWISVNPKKQCYLNYNDKTYKSFSGKDVGIQSINHIFIDIDPINKGVDRVETLKKMYEFVKIILQDLEKQNIKNYCVVCSGYGLQILIKLDVPLMLPEQVWDEKSKGYILSSNFDNYKRLIKDVFLSRLRKKFSCLAKDYDCEIDKSCGNIGRVCAFCPETYNIKYNTKVLRKILILKNEEENKGLSDWLIDEIKNIKTVVKYSNNKPKQLDNYFKLTEKNLINNELVQWILKNDLPKGMRNNYVVYSLKCLLKDNNISFNSDIVKHIRMVIEQKWGESIPFNIPEDRFHFSSNIINSFCIYNRLPLLYKFYYDNRPLKPRNVEKHIFTYNNYQKYPIKDLSVKVEGDDTVQRVYNLRKMLLDIKDNFEFVNKLYSGLYYMEISKDDIKYILKEVAQYYLGSMLI